MSEIVEEPMWEEFIPRVAELQPDESKRPVCYGVCRCMGRRSRLILD